MQRSAALGSTLAASRGRVINRQSALASMPSSILIAAARWAEVAALSRPNRLSRRSRRLRRMHVLLALRITSVRLGVVLSGSKPSSKANVLVVRCVAMELARGAALTAHLRVEMVLLPRGREIGRLAQMMLTLSAISSATTASGSATIQTTPRLTPLTTSVLPTAQQTARRVGVVVIGMVVALLEKGRAEEKEKAPKVAVGKEKVRATAVAVVVEVLVAPWRSLPALALLALASPLLLGRRRQCRGSSRLRARCRPSFLLSPTSLSSSSSSFRLPLVRLQLCCSQHAAE